MVMIEETFVCLDCEATGLDIENDRIIELAAIKFNLKKNIETTTTLINPKIPIPKISQDIHHISDEMVKDSPTIDKFLKSFLNFIGDHTIVGHGIKFDIDLISNEAKRCRLPCKIYLNESIDTLRLARLYGKSPSNSLETLRNHFNIGFEIAHRALNDVIINIEIFKKLIKPFKTKKEILERLKKPILMKNMPLGKYKGREFSLLPLDYLKWAAKQDFDTDLLHSIRSEINIRKRQETFEQAANPFSKILGKKK